MFSDQTKQNLCVGTKAISKREPGLKMILIKNIQILKHGPNLIQIKQARNLRRCALKAGKTSTRKTENLAHLTYPHTESGMR